MILTRNIPRSLRSEIVRYIPAIWGFALSISGDPDTADDLTQTTCLRALEKQDQLVTGSPVVVGLIAICRSIWIDERRAESIRKTGGLHTAAAADLIDLREDPEKSIFALQVYAKIMKLPEAQRATVELVYVQQFTYTEAANILDVPVGTVMSRLSTARAALAGLNAAEDRRMARTASCRRT